MLFCAACGKYVLSVIMIHSKDLTMLDEGHATIRVTGFSILWGKGQGNKPISPSRIYLNGHGHPVHVVVLPPDIIIRHRRCGTLPFDLTSNVIVEWFLDQRVCVRE